MTGHGIDACELALLGVIGIVLLIFRDRSSHIVVITVIAITTDIQLSRNTTIWHFPQSIMIVLIRSLTV